MTGLAIALHLLAAILWVGGMAFAHACLRPVLLAQEPPLRLMLFRQVLGRFLPIALASALVLLASGYLLLFGAFGGFGTAPVYVHIMHGLGLIMVALLLHLFFAPWRRFKAAFAAGDRPAAAAAAAQVRTIVAINLGLGLVTSVIGTGRYWLA